MSEGHLLTEREVEILRQVATGASNRQIAQRLHISANTVKVHLRNIFGKLEVSSRTEATLYAIQHGLVEGIDSSSVSTEQAWWRRAGMLIPGVLFIAGAALAAMLMLRARRTTAQIGVDVDALERARWEVLAPMSTGRRGHAVAVHEGLIYAIAGESVDGVTDIVERYDPTNDTWESLPSKPTAVTDIRAALLEGKIFLPGGRLASGEATDVLEVFDPTARRWSRRASLPKPVSAYALTAFEGALYLFGGWDGKTFTDDVVRYKPLEDEWEIVAALGKPKAYIDAAVSGGKIYLIGGYDGEQALSDLDLFSPDLTRNGGVPWITQPPLPSARYGAGVGTIADIIYVLGGSEEGGGILEFFPRTLEWKQVSTGDIRLGRFPGLASDGEFIYFLGGELGGEYLSKVYRYRAVYTIFLPLSSNP